MGAYFESEITAKRHQIEHNVVVTGIGKSWVGFRLVWILAAQLKSNHRFWDVEFGGHNWAFKLRPNGDSYSKNSHWDVLQSFVYFLVAQR